MIYVLDALTGQHIYVNPLNVIYATRNINNNTIYYDIYLNNNIKIKVHEDQFLKIKKEINQCLQ